MNISDFFFVSKTLNSGNKKQDEELNLEDAFIKDENENSENN